MHGLLPILMVRPAAYPVDSLAGFAYYSWQRRFELPACGRFTNAAKAVATLPRRQSRRGGFFSGLVLPRDPRGFRGSLRPRHQTLKRHRRSPWAPPFVAGGRPMNFFPAFFDLKDRPALIVGGGEPAARRLRLLQKAGARITVVAPRVGPEIASAIGTGKVAAVRRGFVSGDINGQVIVFAATGLPAVDHRVPH